MFIRFNDFTCPEALCGSRKRHVTFMLIKNGKNLLMPFRSFTFVLVHNIYIIIHKKTRHQVTLYLSTVRCDTGYGIMFSEKRKQCVSQHGCFPCFTLCMCLKLFILISQFHSQRLLCFFQSHVKRAMLLHINLLRSAGLSLSNG